jgi:hypothetical protein
VAEYLRQHLPSLYPVTLAPETLSGLATEYKELMKLHHPDVAQATTVSADEVEVSKLDHPHEELTVLRGSDYYLANLPLDPENAGSLITHAHAMLKKPLNRITILDDLMSGVYLSKMDERAKTPRTDPDLLEYSMDVHMGMGGADEKELRMIIEENERRVAVARVDLEAQMRDFVDAVGGGGEEEDVMRQAMRVKELCGTSRYLETIDENLEIAREKMELKKT